MAQIGEIIVKISADIEAFQRTIAEAVMPPMHAFAHTMHAWWFDELPWYRRWWHVMTGHRGRHPWDV